MCESVGFVPMTAPSEMVLARTEIVMGMPLDGRHHA